MEKKSHGFVWKSDYKDYIKSSGITHGYVMYIGDKITAMGFICETDDNVYFENFSYDIEYRKYSLGMIVYYYIICDMIKDKKQIMYLSGGWLDYKKWYNGTLTYTFSGKILRQSKYPILRYIKSLKFW